MPSLVEEWSLGKAETITRLLRSICYHAKTFHLSDYKLKTEFIKELWKWVHIEHKSSCLQRRKKSFPGRVTSYTFGVELHQFPGQRPVHTSAACGGEAADTHKPVTGRQLTLTSLRAPENEEADTAGDRAFELCSV